MATVYLGADVYVGQGAIDWATYAANKSFVIIKAGGADDGLYTDSAFYTNQTGARAQAGLRIGYYFFGDRRVDATTAVNYFINILGSLNNGEILVLDIEGKNYPPDDWAYIFVTGIYNTFSFYPFVYMSQETPGDPPTAFNWPTTNPKAKLWMANYGLSSTDFSQVTGNADSTWGGLPAPNYRILQYSSSGTVPGVPGNSAGFVDLDSFYSPNNTIADWDTLGFAGGGPPVPSPGTLTIASVTNPTITYTEPALQTINLPAESYDQVLFSDKFATSVTSSSWPVNIAGPTTGLNQYAYPIGNYRYSINGSSNLNDFGFINAGDYGQFPGTLPTVVVQPIVASNGDLSFDVVVNNISGSVTVGLTLNIALLAYANTTSVPVTSVSQAVSRSNVVMGGTPHDYSTYRRVATDSVVGSGTTTIGHGLSDIPNLLYWVQDNSGDIEPQPVAWSDIGHTTAFGISMDDTFVYFNVDAANNAQCYYRLYKDN